MNIDEIIMRASAIKLLANVGDKQAVFEECNRIIAICEAAQHSAHPTYGTLPASDVYTTPENLPVPVVRLVPPISG